MSSPKFMRIKNISLLQKCETGYIYRHPVPLRMGVGRRHDEGRVAVDAEAATDARGQSVRQRRVVLTPDMLASSSGEISFSGATVARELRLTGESAL